MRLNMILITKEGETYLIKNPDVDFHTKYGFIKKEILKRAKPGARLVTNTCKEFFLIEPGFIDFYKKIKRAPQIMLLKDIAVIVAETGINKNSRVIDAGSGSGAIACFMANLAG